jgi:hypothetical protein
MLSQLREALAVDNALSQKSIRGAVKDGKNKIDTLGTELAQLNEQKAQMQQELMKAKSDLLLERKTQDLPSNKRKYMYKVLGNKTPKFIEENFDYTLNLLEKTEQDRLAAYKQEAEQSKSKVDRPTKQVIAEQTKSEPGQQTPVIEESIEQTSDNPLLTNYMEELKRT